MFRIILAILIMMPGLLSAETAGDPMAVYEMATENNIFIGARAAGMGGAQIAAGNDGSTIWYNPALLCRIRKIELSGTLTHQRFFNNTTFGTVQANQAQLNNTRFSSIWGVFPVPVEQGGLAFGFAANRIKSFDRLFRFEDSPGWFEYGTGDGIGGGEDDRGSLWVYSAAGGIELSRYTSVGLSLDLFYGKDKYTYVEDWVSGLDYYSYSRELDDRYSGYSAKVGLAYSANSNVHLGATIRFPTSLTVEQEEYIIFNDNGDVDRDRAYGEYKYILPFSFGVGGLYSIRDLLLTADVYYTDYTQLEYKSGVDFAEANNDVKNYYRDILSWGVGAEYFFPAWGLTLRAGYNRDPIPFTYFKLDNDYDVYTAGFSYLLDKTLKLDFAVNFLDWTRRDPDFIDAGTIEKYRAQRAYLGFAYRI